MGKIVFSGITFDGKRQKKLFKIFDLMDEFFTDEQKKNMHIEYKNCLIENFVFDFDKKELQGDTTKSDFAHFILGISSKQIKNIKVKGQSK